MHRGVSHDTIHRRREVCTAGKEEGSEGALIY